MVNLLNSYGLAIGEFGICTPLWDFLKTHYPTQVIDEYGVAAEQVPGGGAWWIARLERYNMYGLRGNWLGGVNLQDYLASLLGKSGSTYYGNGGKCNYLHMLYFANMCLAIRVSSVQVLCKLNEGASRRHHWIH
jgi:hypothetical protein